MPVKEVGLIAKERGIPFMLDAAQTAGIYDIDVRDMNIDILAFPGHKGLMGPQGQEDFILAKILMCFR